MGYRRRYKRINRRKRTYRKKYTFSRRVRKTIMRAAETKYTDYIGQPVNVLQGNGQLTLELSSQIVTGVNNGSRIGNKIQIQKIQFTILANTNTQLGIYWRWSFVRSKGAAQQIVITDLPQTVQGYWDIEKFAVYKDQLCTMGNADTDGKDRRVFKPTWNFKNTTLTYDNASGSCNRPIFLVMQTNYGLSADPKPYVSVNFRIFYKDL